MTYITKRYALFALASICFLPHMMHSSWLQNIFVDNRTNIGLGCGVFFASVISVTVSVCTWNKTKTMLALANKNLDLDQELQVLNKKELELKDECQDQLEILNKSTNMLQINPFLNVYNFKSFHITNQQTYDNHMRAFFSRLYHSRLCIEFADESID